MGPSYFLYGFWSPDCLDWGLKGLEGLALEKVDA